ncbi:uncharacterized protein RSE6_13447 [Rhynchosporium secalis]|uniref:Aminoglycoside phosphotransferase domain-containing protein n=1 Tax=Rhynchosporium secalis TaxID=38038 RepID=A0A1E1MSZ4_RHYSE|nr:uncharacterized protein RSE6_13447 [Rhynchosporium secalis]
MLSKSRRVEIGSLTQPAEGATMYMVAENTSIPVPKVHCAFERKGINYTPMVRIPGKMLRLGWLDRSPESKAKILSQIKGIVDQLRLIPPPSDQVISNIAGGPLFDSRLGGGSYHGPFNTLQEFHRHLREDYDGDEDLPDANRLVVRHKQYCGKPVLTHGDLNTMNITV